MKQTKRTSNTKMLIHLTKLAQEVLGSKEKGIDWVLAVFDR